MTDKQVFDIILTLAEREDNIRAFLMEGSRANPLATQDKWRDFDIVYVTRANAPYIDGEWLKREFLPQFGEVAVKQIPDNGDPNLVYTWLIQFASGVRVDLTFNSLEFLSRPDVKLERATVVLLDKDAHFADIPAPSERDYLPKRPTTQEFADCCNEFWWVSPYVSKALARGQLLLALELLNEVVRPEYTQMLVWFGGAKTDFAVNFGKHGWNIGQFVPQYLYEPLINSYPHAEHVEISTALNELISSFPALAAQTADMLGFHYDASEGERTTKFIREYFRSAQNAGE
ncbi:MAG: aminoglycoside 6-adenylyltransferase [Oscillospiraceae bacterium]|jgi:aminoglycoside 6-adenylyltransferase|nr:aminoglycoside 6-adenylyltransferase [Oscillospiraceae bacterium]